MSVEVMILDGQLPPAAPARADGAGGIVVFEGIVRGTEEGRSIAALEYQAYEPMAQRMIARISEELIGKHGVLAIKVEHSKGRVLVGACSFRLTVWGRHRKEALAATDEFIDRLKADVPIWKKAVEI
jgi:molybdopterin synthase catalytic subunit